MSRTRKKRKKRKRTRRRRRRKPQMTRKLPPQRPLRLARDRCSSDMHGLLKSWTDSACRSHAGCGSEILFCSVSSCFPQVHTLKATMCDSLTLRNLFHSCSRQKFKYKQVQAHFLMSIRAVSGTACHVVHRLSILRSGEPKEGDCP
eukprot:1169945-Amphidinium_carterae.1